MSDFPPQLDRVPIPDAAWNDEPTYCLQINDEWVSHVLGVIGYLDDDDAWEGTPEEIQDAREQVAEIMAALMEPCEMPVNPFIVGEIRFFGTEAGVPDGWELCQGQLLSRTDYADLFAAIGDYYNVGDGSTTFGIPDLKGRTPFGYGGSYVYGQFGGEAFHTLDTTEIPSHDHNLQATGANVLVLRQGVSGASAFASGSVASLAAAKTQASGGGGAHENRPPYLVLVPAIYSGVLDD